MVAELDSAAVVAIVMWIVLGVCFVATLVTVAVYRLVRHDQVARETQRERQATTANLKHLERLTDAGHFEVDVLPAGEDGTWSKLPVPRVRGRIDD